MRQKTGLSQESLKLIACISMLIDHVGAIFLPGVGLRIIGRIAFPIYCFVLTEGAHYTRNPKKYTARLLIGAVLTELPYDLAFSGTIDLESCSVMVTLLLGLCAIMAMRQYDGIKRVATIAAAYLAAEFLHTDYAGTGIMVILLFEITRQMPSRRLWQLAGLTALCWSGYSVRIGCIVVPIQLFAVLAMIPITLYDGRKVIHSRVVQWLFYLFYPLHLLVLWGISVTLL